jgi:hypothetical protein
MQAKRVENDVDDVNAGETVTCDKFLELDILDISLTSECND